jgi:hypothetical protein
MRTHELFAVKVVKNKPAYLNQSKMEVAILELASDLYHAKGTMTDGIAQYHPRSTG